MNDQTISNLINVTLCLVALFVAVRSFDIHAQFRYTRLFILGLSMTLVSLSAAAEFVASYIKLISLHTDWFLDVAQVVGFLFIFLSLLPGLEKHLQKIMYASVITFLAVLLLLALSPLLPPINALTAFFMQTTRFVLCFCIYFVYLSSLLSKPTLFNRLMCISFFLLSFGYLMILLQGFAVNPNLHLIGNLGNITNVLGLGALVTAVSWN